MIDPYYWHQRNKSRQLPFIFCWNYFLFFCQFYHFFPTQRKNICHRLYYMIFEIHSHQTLNKCFFFFGFLDNNIITQSIRSFRIINSFITFLTFRSFLPIFIIIICNFFCHFVSVKSSVLVCDISYFSDSEVSVVSGLSSLFSFNSLLFPGRNGDKAWYFMFFFFFGMRFSGVTFKLVRTVKPISPFYEDKEYIQEAVYL